MTFRKCQLWMTFLKIVVSMVGYTYNPWFTITWQTSFQWTYKAALPPSLPFQDHFHFSSLPFNLPPSRPPQCQATGALLWKLPVGKLSSSGKSVVSIEKKWKKKLCIIGQIGPGPRDSSWRGPGRLPNIFFNVAWLLLISFTFIRLDLQVSFFFF